MSEPIFGNSMGHTEMFTSWHNTISVVENRGVNQNAKPAPWINIIKTYIFKEITKL